MKKKNLRGKRPRLTELVEAIQQEFINHPDALYTIKKIGNCVGVRTIREQLAVREILNNLVNFDFLTKTEYGLFGLKKNTPGADEAYEKDTFVGKLEISDRGGYVAVRSSIFKGDIFVPHPLLHGAKDEQKVIVRLRRWRPGSSTPEGEVIDILGDTGDNNTEMHAILAEFDLPYSYPAQLEEEADRMSGEFTPKDLENRRDMRQVCTFTIDPRDAKDFDDAISIRTLGTDGNTDSSSAEPLYEIGVHIADVSHYVKPGSNIDKEAYKRATSVYLVDRTIPMLPEHLCNILCSLRPDEDKLAYSVIFRMDDKAHILDYEICHTVIRSNRRFTYEEAQQRIETGQGDFATEINQLNQLAQILRERRFMQGAIAFDREEVRFEIDDKGKPVSVYFKEMKESNQLVEEFMLLANKTVAQHIGKPKNDGRRRTAQPKNFVYRVHDLLDRERVRDFSQFIKRFGYTLKTSNSQGTTSKNFNKLLTQVRGTAEQHLIETLAVRSMAKAVYSTDNIGHYGLAFPFYTHFTSPIRRYPDLMVHRLLDRYSKGGTSVNKSDLEDKCRHCSAQEQLAANAERASIKYKQVEFLSDRIGQEFVGIISGVTEWGIYVEIEENKCEGMVSIHHLDRNDYFVFNEKEYCIEGIRSGKRYQLGDEVKIRVVHADLQRRQLDFSLVEEGTC